ncbi:MAG: hypothetical protein QXS41_00905 [Candidatus Woesearchaeota archaeon]
MLRYKNKFIKLFILFFIFSLILFSGYSKIIVDYYYSETCPHCKKVQDSQILETIKEKYGNEITINKIRVNDDTSFFLELTQKVLKVSPGVPFIIIYSDQLSDRNKLLESLRTGDYQKYCFTYLQGDSEILENLENKVSQILDCCKKNSLNLNPIISADEQKCESTNIEKKNFLHDLILLIGTALADSVNPCIMSVLVLLISYLFTLKRRKDILKYGFFYVVVVYLSYFIIGILLYFGVDLIFKIAINYLSSLSKIIIIFIILLCLFAAIVNIKDFFAYGKGFTFALSEKDKKFVERLIRHLSLPTLIILGLFVTIVEFPCSGIMYVGLVSYLFSSYNFIQFLLLIALYNLLFVLPLLIIVFLTIIVKDPKKIDDFRLKYRKWFRLAMGLLLLILAIYLYKIYF